MNGSGVIDLDDLNALARFLEYGEPLRDEEAADVNGDERIDYDDLEALAEILRDERDPVPIE